MSGLWVIRRARPALPAASFRQMTVSSHRIEAKDTIAAQIVGWTGNVATQVQRYPAGVA
jgi:hypothetical protein